MDLIIKIKIFKSIFKIFFDPPARCGILDFYHNCFFSSSSSYSSSSSCSFSSFSSICFLSTISLSISISISVLPSLGQALSQLPSSINITGPQPGTFRAQYIPPDLNLGPSQLNLYWWTSTTR